MTPLPTAPPVSESSLIHAARFRGIRAAAIWLITGAVLLYVASPPVALLGGVLLRLAVGRPPGHSRYPLGQWLLQACVIGLGFGMDLPTVLRLGWDGFLFAAATIGMTVVLGLWLGDKMKLGWKTSVLIASGTAVCGGSAIAAVSAVILASEAEVAVSLATIFLLNAAALFIFPAIGHALDLSQAQFGLWSGIAIHDISSVVGASLSFGKDALDTATAVKLSRTLWIVPVSLSFAYLQKTREHSLCSPTASPSAAPAPQVPWFIALFLGASLVRSCFPSLSAVSPILTECARRGMVVVLLLVGSSVSLHAVKQVGWKTVATGLWLWLFISISSLAAILCLQLAQ